MSTLLKTVAADEPTLLDEAVGRLRELPAAEQDLAAEAIFAVVYRNEPQPQLTSEQLEEVTETLRGLEDGTTRIATDDEVEEMWRRSGL